MHSTEPRTGFRTGGVPLTITRAAIHWLARIAHFTLPEVIGIEQAATGRSAKIDLAANEQQKNENEHRA